MKSEFILHLVAIDLFFIIDIVSFRKVYFYFYFVLTCSLFVIPYSLFLILKVFVYRKHLVFAVAHDACLLVVDNPLLKEVGLSGDGDEFHPLKWVFCVIDFRLAQGYQQPVSNIFDVLAHHSCIHADQLDRKSV